MENDIDYLAVASYAPKCSWRNKVELRMSHLSRLMAGTILPHDTFGSHLQGKKTVDPELEFRNFTAAGEALAACYHEEQFDGFPINARYVERKGDPEDSYPLPVEQFMTQHCRQCTYSLEFSKCDSPDCEYCGPLRSKYRDIIGGRFLPAVVPFIQSGDNPGLQPAMPDSSEAKYYPDVFAVRALAPNAHSIPPELYLPRKKGVDFNELTCPFGCGVTFVTKAALQRHRVRAHKYKRTPKDLPNEQFEYIPIFEDVAEIIRRANKDSKEFVVRTTQNVYEWRTLPLDHERVQAFVEKAATEEEYSMPEGLPLVNIQRWIAGGVLIDGEDEEDEQGGQNDLENEMTDE